MHFEENPTEAAAPSLTVAKALAVLVTGNTWIVERLAKDATCTCNGCYLCAYRCIERAEAEVERLSKRIDRRFLAQAVQEKLRRADRAEAENRRLLALIAPPDNVGKASERELLRSQMLVEIATSDCIDSTKSIYSNTGTTSRHVQRIS